MQSRLSAREVAPEGYRALARVEEYLQSCGLEPDLIDLVKMRASQINGCAFCLDMHSKHARKRGETEQRLYLLDAWQECALFSPRERAALAWTESLTRVAETRAPDRDYDEVRGQFSDEELVNLTMSIGMINLWNRLAIGFRFQLPVDHAAPAAEARRG